MVEMNIVIVIEKDLTGFCDQDRFPGIWQMQLTADDARLKITRISIGSYLTNR